MIEEGEYIFDMYKMLIGEYHYMIYIEIVIRVFTVMVYTLLMIRWIGRRAVGGLGSADLLLVVAMGSAVGDAMLYPSIPLLLPLLVITTIAFLQKIYVFTAVKNQDVSRIINPQVIKIVENGKLLTLNLTKDLVDKHEVYMMLRQSGIEYLFEVKHAYNEQSGKLSVFKYENPQFKDSILPENTNDNNVAS